MKPLDTPTTSYLTSDSVVGVFLSGPRAGDVADDASDVDLIALTDGPVTRLGPASSSSDWPRG